MSKTILIVEDDDLSMKLFRDLLQSHGYNVRQSVDGVDTMQLAMEYRPALILMDIRLPKVSGIEHVKMLKANEELKHIPVLALTAFAMKGDEEKILDAGCDGYISKPIAVPKFLDEIKKFLTLEPFRLSESLVIGHHLIDAEHAQLGVMSNEFMVFLEASDDKGCVRKTNEISEFIEKHFKNEEGIMEGVGYPNLEAHKEDHRNVISKYYSLVKDAERNGYRNEFASKLTAILVHDMISADVDFKAFFQEMNYQEQELNS